MPTYPRCGSHFFVEHFLQKTGVVINKTHAPMTGDYDFYVTIIRNPFDSIVSRLAMELEFNENPKTMQEYIDICIKEYKVFYSYIEKKINIVFNYDEINNHIDDMVNYLCDVTKIGRISDNFIDNIHDRPSTKFLKTSKTSVHYEYCFNFLKNTDLTELWQIYYKIKEKSISFV